jgi:hypothetical protein
MSRSLQIRPENCEIVSGSVVVIVFSLRMYRSALLASKLGHVLAFEMEARCWMATPTPREPKSWMSLVVRESRMDPRICASCSFETVSLLNGDTDSSGSQS